MESDFNLKMTGRKAVEEVPYGVYVWKCTDGEYLGDEEGRLLQVFAMKGDRNKIRALVEVAKGYGYEGEPVFWSGRRPVTDDEYQEQLTRQKLGLTPDPLDYGALADEQNARRY